MHVHGAQQKIRTGLHGHVFLALLFFFSSSHATSPTARAAEYPITEFGARADGQSLNTEAIQKAIDDAAEAGGGTVVIPRGVFLSGAIFLKQGVDLQLAEGAVLKGSTQVADYPKMNTRVEGHFEPWLPALVNAYDMNRVRITGAGTLDGNGKPFWTAFWRRRSENPQCTNLEVERPRLMFLQRCSNVVVEGIHLKDSGFWNLHLYRCQNALIDGISITAPHGSPPEIIDVDQPWNEIEVNRAPSSDGIDVDSCQNVTIRRCTISVGDDCVALKGSKGPLALEDESSPPVENIRIEDCNFVSGHGMVTCGSEATIIRNVEARNCKVGVGIPIVRLKLRPDTPQLYEKFLIENVSVDGAQALFDVKPWTQFFDLRGHEPPASVVRDVTIRNVTGTLQSLGELRGNDGDTISDVSLEDISVTVKRDQFRVDDREAVEFKNVVVNGSPYSLNLVPLQ